MERRILHVDMDAFFASVEQARDPALQGRPVVVGGLPGQRGVVSAASYEARRYGLHSAMPLVVAHRLCPHAVFLPGDFNAYRFCSRRLMEMFRELTPLVEPRSLDEAYLDLTGCELLWGPPPEVAAGLKKRIRRELGITASVGIASNKLVAKIASDFRKPDGLVEVAAGQEASFLAGLPVRALPGVGLATAQALQNLGIGRVGDLAQAPLAVLRSRFDTLASHLVRMARGQDDSPVDGYGEAKSISRSITFASDTYGLAFVRAAAGCLAERVCSRLRERSRAARTVHLQLRFSDFETISRSSTLRTPTDSDQVVFDEVERLLSRSLSGKRIRLVGVGVSGLGPLAFQTSLLDQHAAGFKLDRCLDAIRARYGFRSVLRGRTLASSPSRSVQGGVDGASRSPGQERLLPAMAEAIGQRGGKV
ncbi:MAG: DNA polymerase IV [Dehalococcoidia bacterium]|nr:DNA polymerase IV [Dehalococcoidia bacterium]